MRLPRPLPDSVTSVVFSLYSSPCTVTVRRVTVIAAFPLNLPADLASITVPVAFAPFGITTLSPTTTGSAMEASKRSPELLVFELTDSSAVITILLPAFTTIGLGAKTDRGADSGAFSALDPSGAGAFAADEVAEFPVFPLEETPGSVEVAELRQPKRVRTLMSVS